MKALQLLAEQKKKEEADEQLRLEKKRKQDEQQEKIAREEAKATLEAAREADRERRRQDMANKRKRAKEQKEQEDADEQERIRRKQRQEKWDQEDREREEMVRRRQQEDAASSGMFASYATPSPSQHSVPAPNFEAVLLSMRSQMIAEIQSTLKSAALTPAAAPQIQATVAPSPHIQMIAPKPQTFSR